jgi:hypothetical protein
MSAPAAAQLPASVEGLLGGGGGGGKGKREEEEEAYVRSGGVMVILDDGLGSALPWTVVQGQTVGKKDSAQRAHAEGRGEQPRAQPGAGDGTSDLGVGGLGEGVGLWRLRDVCPKSDVKLYKQWLSSDAMAGSSADLYASHTIPRRFAADVLATAAACSTYKFLLRITSPGGRMRRPAVLLQLLSWNSRFNSNRVPLLADPLWLKPKPQAQAQTQTQAHLSTAPQRAGGSCAGGKGANSQGVGPVGEGTSQAQYLSHPAVLERYWSHPVIVQCLYCSFASDAGTARRLYAQWTEASENNVECVDISEEEEAELSVFLRQSTCLLPPPLRVLNGLPVGFLPA